MSEDYFYQTIEKLAIAEFKDRGSRFIAFASPVTSVSEFKEKLTALKKEHAKATHHCFAYRIGMDGLQYRVSDDGEPSGSAGRPILGQIDGRQLTNVLIVVIRYFGGSLLGVPGLIHAYKTVAALSLEAASIVQKLIFINYRLQFDYLQMNEVMKLVKQFNCMILKQEMQLFSVLEIGVPKQGLQEIVNKFKVVRNLEAEAF